MTKIPASSTGASVKGRGKATAKSALEKPVGDSLAPPLRADLDALTTCADQSVNIKADAPPRTVPAPTANLASHMKANQTNRASPTDCKQVLWFSFFFDGTGNNMDADIGTNKHSNIVRLYRVHPKNDKVKGTYAFYIPGVGTYFRDVKDPGGSVRGLLFGDMGVERINWAIAQFDENLARHLARAKAPANAISEVNISAFGFSRGAALARAFVNEFLRQRCVHLSDDTWKLVQGPQIFIRFMGLFDTVASAGPPMSFGSTGAAGAAVGAKKVQAGAEMLMGQRNLKIYGTPAIQAEVLAFAAGARPGADPGTGSLWNGHKGYGAFMAIPLMVEEVRHFVATHEIRNSFPLDSVAVVSDGNISKPAKFFEHPYPGMHSDVGGSYRPGEGGRSFNPQEKLGLIPLKHMYDFALKKRVPLLPICAWDEDMHADFTLSEQLLKSFSNYINEIGKCNSLGEYFNRHMALYYAWRFRTIRIKAVQPDGVDKHRIGEMNMKFSAEGKTLTKSVAQLKSLSDNAEATLKGLISRRAMLEQPFAGRKEADFREPLLKNAAETKMAEIEFETAKDNWLREQARLNALPDMNNYYALLSMYDKELVANARAIKECCDRYPGRISSRIDQRKNLRPHYKVLLEAYESEYGPGAGLNKPEIFAFFDNYVHDSLAGFAKDATLPSDPRVIYVGGNKKSEYASNDNALPESDSRDIA